VSKRDRQSELVRSLDRLKEFQWPDAPAQCFIEGELNARHNVQVLYVQEDNKFWLFDESVGTAELFTEAEMKSGKIGEAIRQERLFLYC
jgi:hypothetical protein